MVVLCARMRVARAFPGPFFFWWVRRGCGCPAPVAPPRVIVSSVTYRASLVRLLRVRVALSTDLNPESMKPQSASVKCLLRFGGDDFHFGEEFALELIKLIVEHLVAVLDQA